MQEERQHVVTKLAQIMGEMGVIGKDKKKDSKLTYGYQGIDEAVNALNPLMARHGVIATIQIKEKTITEKTIVGKDYDRVETTANITCIVTFTDGYTEVKTDEGAIMADNGKKAVTQAISMCYKYALLRTFLIRTKGEVDPDENVIDEPIYRKQVATLPPTEKQLKEVFLSEVKKAGIEKEFVALTQKVMGEKFNEWLHMKPELKSDYITELKNQLTKQV